MGAAARLHINLLAQEQPPSLPTSALLAATQSSSSRAPCDPALAVGMRGMCGC